MNPISKVVVFTLPVKTKNRVSQKNRKPKQDKWFKQLRENTHLFVLSWFQDTSKLLVETASAASTIPVRKTAQREEGRTK